MERLYRVVFDTQRDRRYITWGYYVSANNQREAKDKAYQHWNSSDNPHYSYGFGRGGKWYDVPHMFHVDAARMKEEERDRDMRKFYVIENRYASWG